MTTIRIKGDEITLPFIKDSHYRRATQCANKIKQMITRLGVHVDAIDIEVPVAALKKTPAVATWYMDGYVLQYDYADGTSYAQNIAVVAKVIELQIQKLENQELTHQQFIRAFSEDEDVEEQRKHARTTLGVDEQERDLKVIAKKYKDLARTLHPDMETGDVEKFKELNRAHKILVRELS
jgi:hypothetical protein